MSSFVRPSRKAELAIALVVAFPLLSIPFDIVVATMFTLGVSALLLTETTQKNITAKTHTGTIHGTGLFFTLIGSLISDLDWWQTTLVISAYIAVAIYLYHRYR